jgi:hypothetical protein
MFSPFLALFSNFEAIPFQTAQKEKMPNLTVAYN